MRHPPGAQRRYQRGGATLAERTGKPVVPVAHNAGLYWPRNSFIKYPGTIRLVIGAPIDSRGKNATEINQLAKTWIEATVDDLLKKAAEGPAYARNTDAAETSR